MQSVLRYGRNNYQPAIRRDTRCSECRILTFPAPWTCHIDEEHEQSFKQQDPAPRYHARSAAIVLAQMYAGAKTLLGTATPSMETYYNAQQGKYGLVELTRAL